MQGSGLCDNQQSHILHDLTTMISLDAGRHHSPKLKNNKRLNKHLCSQSQRALVDKRPDVSISAQTAQIPERPDRKTQPTLDSSFENVHGWKRSQIPHNLTTMIWQHLHPEFDDYKRPKPPFITGLSQIEKQKKYNVKATWPIWPLCKQWYKYNRWPSDRSDPN